MTVKSAIKKYIILAISGAAIIGIGTFFLLNSYFERVGIVVAKTGIPAGQELTESDIEYQEYYSGSLPAGYIEKKGDVIGKILSCERRSGDPITESVFEKVSRTSMVEELGPGEVLMALDISFIEPLVEELNAGNRISIVSTEKEKTNDLNPGIKTASVAGKTDNKNDTYNEADTYQDYSIISPNIIVIDGHIIIKNLEIVDIRVPGIKEESLLVSSRKANPYIFIKCSINEAPVISRITKEDKYKIFMERM
jgi:hypothetical protein